jgi:hypothetical protein
MRSIGQQNLETIMIDFLGALRRGDFEAASTLLDPAVTWQGLREEWSCQRREEVIDTFRWGLNERRDIDALSSSAAAGSCASTTTGAGQRRSPLLASLRMPAGTDVPP